MGFQAVGFTVLPEAHYLSIPSLPCGLCCCRTENCTFSLVLVCEVSVTQINEEKEANQSVRSKCRQQIYTRLKHLTLITCNILNNKYAAEIFYLKLSQTILSKISIFLPRLTVNTYNRKEKNESLKLLHLLWCTSHDSLPVSNTHSF